MSDGTVLTALIVAVGFAAVAGGAVRGGLREALLGASILFGGLLASLKAEAWGDWLDEYFEVRTSLARFEAGLATIIGSSLVLGLIGGALCDRRSPSLGGRLLGAILGLGNAVLLLGFGLQLYEHHYRAGVRQAPITDSWAASALVDHFDILLVLGGSALAGFIVLGHVLHRLIGVGYKAELEPALTWVQQSQRRSRSVRIPADADDGKIEPDEERSADPRRASIPNLRASVAVAATQPPPEAAPHDDPVRPFFSDDRRWPAFEGGPDERTAPPGDRSLLDRWLHVPGAGASDVDASRPVDQGPELSTADLRRILNLPDEDRSGGSSRVPERKDRAQAGRRGVRCPACNSWLSDPSLPCPFCGG